MDKNSVLHLVGFINGDPFRQTYFGALIFDEKEDEVLTPLVRQYDHCNHVWDGHPLTNVSLLGRQGFDVPTWCNGQGLSIWYDTRHTKEWRFTTGIHSGWQSGSSGTLEPSAAERVMELLIWQHNQV